MKKLINFLFISICLIALGVFLSGTDSLILTILGYVLALWGAVAGWGAIQQLLSVWRMLRLQKQDPKAFAQMVSAYVAASEAVREEEEEKYRKTQVANAMIQEFEVEVKTLAAQHPDKSQHELEVIAADIVKRRNPDHYPVESQ